MNNYHNISELNKYLYNKHIIQFSSLSKYNILLRFSYLFRINGYISIDFACKLKYGIISNNNTYLSLRNGIGKFVSAYLEINDKHTYNDDIIRNYSNLITGIKMVKYVENPSILNRLNMKPKIIYYHEFYGGFHIYKNTDNIPNSVEKIYFGNTFDCTIKNLPNSVKYINTGDYFNSSVDELPNSVKTIIFGNRFNRNVDKLPKSIKAIKFGDNFNKKVCNLPKNLKKIYFGFDFSESIDELPDSVEKIALEYACGIKVCKYPKMLKKIYIPEYYGIPDFLTDLCNVKIINAKNL